jgi:hypothetical protein
MELAPSGGTTARHATDLNRLAAVAFVLGGSLFALGALLAQTGTTTPATVNVTYLVGGFFFSLGGYVSILLVDEVAGSPGSNRAFPVHRRRVEAPPTGWSSAVVLFVGTLLFAVSLVAAFAEGLTPRQSNGWIWLPDILGCVCFLVAGHLALNDVGEGRALRRSHSRGWWVAAVNQLGSILFIVAGIAAFTRPATSRAVDIGLVNWGTFAGAVCFALGGLVQVFDNPARPQGEQT